MRVESQADVRLGPLAAGLWLSESLTLACSGRENGPVPSTVAGGLVLAATTLALGFAVRAWPKRRRRMISRACVGPAVAEADPVDDDRPGGLDRNGWAGALIVGALGLGVGAGLACLHAGLLQAEPIGQLVRARAVIEAELVIDSEPVVTEVATNFAGVSRRWRLRASTVSISEGDRDWRLAVPVTLVGTDRVADSAPQLHIGMRVKVQAAVLAPQHARPEAMRLAVRGSPRVIEPAPWWDRRALAFRESMRAAAAGLPADARGLLPGLVVGDDSGLASATATAMRTVGMSHLTAVSGSNLAIVTGVVLLLLRRIGIGRRSAVGIALLAMIGFVLVVGPQPSVLRAAIMATIALACLATGRPRTGSSALLATVVLLLLLDPWLALNWGFALSVSATAGLLVWALQVRRAAAAAPAAPAADDGSRQRWRQRWRTALRSAVMVAVVCELATAPLVAALGGGIPLIGVVANAAAVPAVPIATVLGLAAAAVGLFWPAAAGALAVPAGYAATWITDVARFAATVPGGVIPWPSGLIGGASLTAVLAAAALTGWRLHRRPDAGPLIRSKLSPRRKRAVVAAALALVAVATLLTRAASLVAGWPPQNWLITFCDVGQGDAVVLRSGPNHAVVVDVGPEPRSVDRCLRDLHVDVIDCLVLTHFHTDHVEGLPGAIAGRSLGRVLVSPLRDPPLEAGRVDHWLEGEQRTATTAPLGEIGQIGDVWYQVVWPRRVIHDGSMPNNASVTLIARVRDLTVLLPGDLEAQAQGELMSSIPSPETLVTKIPHHGSRNQDPGLARWAKSRIAVASVGRQNTYGHPAQQTLDEWRHAGAIVKRTDLDGDVIVWRDAAGELTVRGRSDSS